MFKPLGGKAGQACRKTVGKTKSTRRKRTDRKESIC
jgi:hypothetical protein